MFSYGYFVYVCVAGLSSKGLVHNLLMQFLTLGSLKIEVSDSVIFDIDTTHNHLGIHLTT